MTAALRLPRVADAVPDEEYVLPEHLTAGTGLRGPRFGDDVWDLRAFVPRTNEQARVDLHTLADPLAIRTVKEYLRSRIRHTSTSAAPGQSHGRRLKLTAVYGAFRDLRTVLTTLRDLGAPRLAQVTPAHLEAALRGWKTGPLGAAARYVTVLKTLAAHGAFLTQDRLSFSPWLGRAANAVVGRTQDKENSTRRIPEHIVGPLIKGAAFYVQTASHDLIAAHRKLEALQQARTGQRLNRGEALARLHRFIDGRRQAGRGLPAIPVAQASTVAHLPIVNGVVQGANRTFICLLAGVRDDSSFRGLLAEAGDELGYEPGGLGSPLSVWSDSGLPWRQDLDPYGVRREMFHLRTASWTLIAYLSGMRDQEIRELGRDCAFTEPGEDGRIRHKLRGRVFKDRQLAGDEAEWVVLDVVHQAVDVLVAINDDPGHLFGFLHGARSGHVLLRNMNTKLNNFRDHLNDLLGTPSGPYIPNDIAPAGSAVGGEGPDDTGDDLPWPLATRQFRRTLAWHIAHQPFGIVAGARQYHHAKTVLFEGYAGTSQSGFAAEVASEEAVAKLDYLEDLYQDWNDGGPAAGGAAEKINGEFARIRRELGDLPGVVAAPARLRAMLQHLTRTLHPGVLNDCFYQATTAVCAKRANQLRQPLPMLNSCSVCPNARRSAVHLPRLITARDQLRDALLPATPTGKSTAVLPPLQQIALTDHLTNLDQMITSVHAGEPATDDH